MVVGIPRRHEALDATLEQRRQMRVALRDQPGLFFKWNSEEFTRHAAVSGAAAELRVPVLRNLDGSLA